jgi:ELWxxDGT repeat protein
MFEDAIKIGETIFYAHDDGKRGMELWMDDGRRKPRLVADLYRGPRSSSPDGLAYVNGRLTFAATTRDYGRELFTLDLAAMSSAPPLRPTASASRPPSRAPDAFRGLARDGMELDEAESWSFL